MSTAWMAPVPLWRESRTVSIARVGGRSAAAAAWALASAFAARNGWIWLALLLALVAVLAAAHAGLAVANLVRHRGVVLMLMPSGAIEWPASLQEVWLKRPQDFVDGTDIVVIPGKDFPGPSWYEPRVTLRGAGSSIKGLPLYGYRVATFIERVNEVTAPRGIVLRVEGSPVKDQAASA